jgi:TonB family protein
MKYCILFFLLSQLATASISDSVENEQQTVYGQYIFIETAPQFDKNILTNYLIYPILAKLACLEGRVEVDVLINETGIPIDIKIINSDSPLFDSVVVNAIRKTPFTPATQNMHPVKCWLRMPFRFVLKTWDNFFNWRF